MKQLSKLLFKIPASRKAILLITTSLFTQAALAQSPNFNPYKLINSGEVKNSHDYLSDNTPAKKVEQYKQIEIQFSSKVISEKLSIHIPQNWIGKEVVFELYTDNGDKIQKVIEHKSSRIEILDMEPLVAGSFLIKASCGSEFALQTVIHTQQL